MRLLQFGDSMLPVGALLVLERLESASSRASSTTWRRLREFVRTAMRQAAHGRRRSRCSHAHRAAGAATSTGVDGADRAVFERKLNEEMRTMTVRMGRKLAELADAVVGDDPAIDDWLGGHQAGGDPGHLPGRAWASCFGRARARPRRTPSPSTSTAWPS